MFRFLPGLIMLLLGVSLHAANDTWIGGNSPDFNWNTNANWNNLIPVADASLFFDGTAGLNNTNNISSNTEFGGITFNGSAGSFILNGNQLTLANGGGITNNSALVQTNNLGLGLAVTNNNYINYVTTPGGGQLVIESAINWANAAVTNDVLLFTGAKVKAANSSSTSSFGIGGNSGSVSNTLILRNSIVDGIGLRRINSGNGIGDEILMDNSVATNIDGLIIGNGATSFGTSLIVSNGSKVYINGSDLYELGRNTGASGNQIVITGPGSAILSGGHAFAIGGSSGTTTNSSVQVNNGGLWNLGGSTFRLNFNGPQMSLSANNGTISNVYSMIVGNGNFSNSVTLANGSKFNFSAPSGDFRELGRGANAYDNTLTLTDPNTRWDNGGATFTIGGTASGANNFSNSMTIANGAVFTNGSLQIGSQGANQTLVISNASAYITQLILNNNTSVVYLEGGSGDTVQIDTLGNNAGGVLTNSANTTENILLGWLNGSQTGSPPPLISGLVNLTKIGTGSANMNNAHVFIGNVLVAGGAINTVAQQAAADGSTSAFGCLTNAGKTITITNGGTINLGINNALLNGLTPGTLPPISVYSGSTLNATRFNALGQITLNGGTLLQNSSDAGPLNGYQLYTNVTVGGSAAATISVGANGLPDDLYASTSGGTTFNVANTASGGTDLTVSDGLADYSDGVTAGSLTKTGPGVMVLSGTNTYTGSTVVTGGKLVLYSYSLQSGAVSINDGDTLDVAISGANEITNSTLTLGNGTGATIEFVGLNSTTVAPVVAPNLNLNGTATINLINATLAVGNQYPLITYTAPGGTGGFVIGLKPRGSTMNLVTNNNGNGTFTIALNVVTLPIGPSTDIWSGSQNGNWDINLSTDWTISGSPANYFDGDNVQFTDASGVTNVTLSATVTPGSTIVNSAKNYTLISSSGSHITGSGGMNKSGSGTLTLAGLANTYGGTNVISGGTVSISADSNLGATTNGIFLNGGTLSASASLTLNANRQLLLGPVSGSGSGTLDVATNQTLTYAGVVANDAAGTGSLTKSGPGALNLAGANTYSGSTLVSAGSLAVTTGQVGGGAFTVSDLAALTVTAAPGSTLPMSSLTLGASGNTLVTLNGASSSSPVITATSLTAHGTVSLSVVGAAVQLGEIPLIKYSTLSGTIANFTLAQTLPPNVTAVLTNDTSSKAIALVITGIGGLTWTGLNSANWDIALSTNWVFGAINTVYSDNSAVLFNDTGAKNVTLNAFVSPASVLVNNSSVTYTFTPASAATGIGGLGGFTKLGAGTLNYASVTNSYAGVTVIGAGQIIIGAHPTLSQTGAGSELYEFSTNSVIITNGAFLQLDGVGGGPSVWQQTMSNSITLDNGNIFGSDGGQHLAGPITVGPNGATFGEQQTNKFLYIDGPVSGAGTISIPLPNGVNDGIHTPGGGGYSGPYFTYPANSYNGTISIYNGNIGIQDASGTCLANATLDLEGYNGALGEPAIWTQNSTHTITLGGLVSSNASMILNLTEPVDGWFVALTVGNSTSSTLVYDGSLSDASGAATVTKVGSDTQWLVGSNTYNATTIINSGELGISSLHAGNGAFTVADGASFGVTNIASTNLPSSALISSLNLGSSGATTFEFQNVTNTTTPLIIDSGNLTVNGTSTIKISGINGLAAGNTYPLVKYGSLSGSFSLLLPTGVTATLTNDTSNLWIALHVQSVGPTVNPNPTNIVFSASSGNLSLSWPGDHLGWYLQTQTNVLSTGISTNWVDVPGSSSVTNEVFQLNPNNPAVFYRMSLQP